MWAAAVSRYVRRGLVASSAVILWGACAGPAAAGSETMPDTVGPAEGYAEVVEKLAAFIEPEIERKGIPAFSISVVDGGRVVWARGFGTARSETGRKATANTVYRVGSISKLLTDVAVMRLAAAGRLSLDEDVRKALPGFAPANPHGTPVTLRQLMSHRSGLVRESPVGSYFDETEPTLAATVESLNGTTLVYPPGTKTKYSNAGVAVAGYALEKAVGKPFEEHVAAELLAPLGMAGSGFRRPADRDQVAEGWMWGHDGQRFVAPDFALGTLPAGNLYSSVNDLGRFLVAALGEGRIDGKEVIDGGLLKEMLTPAAQDGPRTFGIGFALSEFQGERAFGHGGAVYGFATQVKGLPDRGVGVAAVASLDCANGFTSRVADYALSLLLARASGQPVEPPATGEPVDRAEARRLRGSYAAGDEFLDLDEYRGRLYLRSGTTLRELRREGDGRFVADDVFGYGPALAVASADEVAFDDKTWKRLPDAAPAEPPERWRGLIGTYGRKHNPLYVLEDRGKLWALIEWFHFYPLEEESENVFAFPDYGLYPGERLVFERDEQGVATRVTAASVAFDRVAPNGPGETFKITPLRVPEELRELAMRASPPAEAGPFREPELIEIAKLDPTIKLDVRYATENNFVGSRFYEQPRAFAQKPAAEAVLRAHEKAKAHGLGVLVYDAYRPWHVTKMFWEATPADLRDFVADPSKGSRHNRGAAVDLTLYDLATGRPVETVAGYDEFSTRAYPESPGGTSRQRWHRRLLRRLMEEEGFEVYEFEWWHFDFGDWRKYPILNVPFEEVGG